MCIQRVVFVFLVAITLLNVHGWLTDIMHLTATAICDPSAVNCKN